MSFITKLENLKIEKKKLIEKRLLEIAKLAEKAGILGLDNNVILGGLLYAKDAYEKQNPEILDHLEVMVNKLPSRKKSALKKSKKNNS